MSDNGRRTEEVRRIIAELSAGYGETAAEKLISYIDMVLERNEHINLTAVRDRDEAMIKHLADSLEITRLGEYREASDIIDVGTGAGFPGALLAIADPEKNFILLDSTLKRLRVIDEFAGTLGIANIRTVHARAEEIQRKEGYAGAFDLCISRAVASLDKLAGWCLPFVRKGGFMIAYKGENYNEEIKAAGSRIASLGGSVDRVVSYSDVHPDISGHVLIVIRRS